MKLPRRFLTTTAQVLVAAKGPPDRLGQATTTWQPVGQPVPCASYPAGKKMVDTAQLRGVKVSREVYLERLALDPQKNRIRVDGVDYQITLASDWEDDFAQLGVSSV